MGLPLKQSLPASDAICLARQVIETEITGLEQLRRGIGPSFTQAIDLLFGLSGRVIVTGVGKSGHIGRKIASTFASTGTAAQFVHPSEASHGDLGMISQGDVVIALSNSGEAAELADIIAYTSRFGITLIAITAVETSPLAKAANLVLLIPQAEEACTLGLAPTTSTTIMMALGDALAVVLLEKRGFGRDDYGLFHPGGKLGRGLLRVSSLMHGENLPLAGMQTTVGDAIVTMTAARFGCTGIVDEAGALIGIVTDGDLSRHLQDIKLTDSASSIMTKEPLVVGPDVLAGEALRIMTERKHPISVLFVVEDRIPVGILHIHDLLHAGIL
jgi:arabinose-5-phosphate isomerase